MKQTKQQLYERIMKKVAPIVKQAINEKFNSINEAASKKRKNSRPVKKSGTVGVERT